MAAEGKSMSGKAAERHVKQSGREEAGGFLFGLSKCGGARCAKTTVEFRQWSVVVEQQ
jgi:hypothetical protein